MPLLIDVIKGFCRLQLPLAFITDMTISVLLLLQLPSATSFSIYSLTPCVILLPIDGHDRSFQCTESQVSFHEKGVFKSLIHQIVEYLIRTLTIDQTVLKHG